jgi:hypothetical protein
MSSGLVSRLRFDCMTCRTMTDEAQLARLWFWRAPVLAIGKYWRAATCLNVSRRACVRQTAVTNSMLNREDMRKDVRVRMRCSGTLFGSLCSESKLDVLQTLLSL